MALLASETSVRDRKEISAPLHCRTLCWRKPYPTIDNTSASAAPDAQA